MAIYTLFLSSSLDVFLLNWFFIVVYVYLSCVYLLTWNSFFFFFLVFFRATPTAYESSQARGWIKATPWISNSRIWLCHELWCRSQMRLRSRVAVAFAEAGGYSSDLTPSLGTSICWGSSRRNGKKTKKEKKEKEN